MLPALPGTVLERKRKIPSAQNVPQEGEDEVAPTASSERKRNGEQIINAPRERLEGMKTYSQSGISPGMHPAL